MKSVGINMRKFFVSLAYVPSINGEDPEVLSNIKIRTSKNSYLYVPVYEHDFDSKEEFVNKMLEMAEGMWEHIESTEEEDNV
jgi:hypothetical protein